MVDLPALSIFGSETLYEYNSIFCGISSATTGFLIVVLNRGDHCKELFRTSPRRCSVKKGALKNFAKLTRRQLCQSLFFNKVPGLRPATLLKMRLWRRCFSVNFAKFLRTLFLQNSSRRLLLIFL